MSLKTIFRSWFPKLGLPHAVPVQQIRKRDVSCNPVMKLFLEKVTKDLPQINKNLNQVLKRLDGSLTEESVYRETIHDGRSLYELKIYGFKHLIAPEYPKGIRVEINKSGVGSGSEELSEDDKEALSQVKVCLSNNETKGRTTFTPFLRRNNCFCMVNHYLDACRLEDDPPAPIIPRNNDNGKYNYSINFSYC